MTERSAIRDAAIRAMLPIAAGQGWNRATVRAGLAAIGEDPALAESHFPTGATGAVAAWIDLANRDMEAAAAAEGVTGLRVPARIRRVVELRLAAVAPHKPALRRALSLLAIPCNAPVALRTTAATVDAMWHAAGEPRRTSPGTPGGDAGRGLWHDPRLLDAERRAGDRRGDGLPRPAAGRPRPAGEAAPRRLIDQPRAGVVRSPNQGGNAMPIVPNHAKKRLAAGQLALGFGCTTCAAARSG